MKIQNLLFSVFLIFAMSACASEEEIEVSCEDFYETQHRSYDIKIGVGNEFTLALCSNPSTGFQWAEQAEISDSELITQVTHEVVPPAEKDSPPPPGTPGDQVWVFKARSPGQCTISLDYSQPWDGGEKSTWTFVVNVNIE